MRGDEYPATSPLRTTVLAAARPEISKKNLCLAAATWELHTTSPDTNVPLIAPLKLSRRPLAAAKARGAAGTRSASVANAVAAEARTRLVGRRIMLMWLSVRCGRDLQHRGGPLSLSRLVPCWRGARDLGGRARKLVTVADRPDELAPGRDPEFRVSA